MKERYTVRQFEGKKIVGEWTAESWGDAWELFEIAIGLGELGTASGSFDWIGEEINEKGETVRCWVEDARLVAPRH